MNHIPLNDKKPMRIQSGPAQLRTPGRGKPPVTVRPYAFLHPCRHPGCEREGSYGFGVNLAKRKPGVWFCHEHRADGELIGAAPGGLDW